MTGDGREGERSHLSHRPHRNAAPAVTIQANNVTTSRPETASEPGGGYCGTSCQACPPAGGPRGRPCRRHRHQPRSCSCRDAGAAALSPNPAGFTASEVSTRVARLLNDDHYSPRRAAYDLRKFRSKGLAARIPRSRQYRVDASALRAMAALLLLRDKVLHPLLAAASTRHSAKP